MNKFLFDKETACFHAMQHFFNARLERLVSKGMHFGERQAVLFKGCVLYIYTHYIAYVFWQEHSFLGGIGRLFTHTHIYIDIQLVKNK